MLEALAMLALTVPPSAAFAYAVATWRQRELDRKQREVYENALKQYIDLTDDLVKRLDVMGEQVKQLRQDTDRLADQRL